MRKLRGAVENHVTIPKRVYQDVTFLSATARASSALTFINSTIIYGNNNDKEVALQ
jgi:hypothetical protein